MPRTLDVYLHQDLVGRLIQDEHRRMAFRYAETWLNNPGSCSALAFSPAEDGEIWPQ